MNPDSNIGLFYSLVIHMRNLFYLLIALLFWSCSTSEQIRQSEISTSLTCSFTIDAKISISKYRLVQFKKDSNQVLIAQEEAAQRRLLKEKDDDEAHCKKAKKSLEREKAFCCYDP